MNQTLKLATNVLTSLFIITSICKFLGHRPALLKRPEMNSNFVKKKITKIMN